MYCAIVHNIKFVKQSELFITILKVSHFNIERNKH